MDRDWQVQVLRQLQAIRQLLEWQKADTLQRREELKAECEADHALFIQTNNEMLEKAKANALEVQRQAQREHEERCHRQPASKRTIVQ